MMKRKGWKLESARHSLAAKGVKTGKKKPYFIQEPYGLPRELQPTGKFRRREDKKKSKRKYTGTYYYCSKCVVEHQEGSKIYQKHFAYS